MLRAAPFQSAAESMIWLTPALSVYLRLPCVFLEPAPVDAAREIDDLHLRPQRQGAAVSSPALCASSGDDVGVEAASASTSRAITP
jgi:hypothetical protein